MGMAG